MACRPPHVTASTRSALERDWTRPQTSTSRRILAEFWRLTCPERLNQFTGCDDWELALPRAVRCAILESQKVQVAATSCTRRVLQTNRIEAIISTLGSVELIPRAGTTRIQLLLTG